MRVDRPVLAALLLAAGALLAAQAPAPPPAPAPASIPAAPPASPSPATGAFATPGTALAGWVVVLDPGHGGDDRGVEAGDLSEAHLTLQIAQKAAATLTAQGARVVFTREADAPAGPDARATTANLAHGHVFISLHLNRSPRPAASGAEVYTHLGATSAPAQPDAAGTAARLTLTPWDRVQDRHADAAESLAAGLEATLGSRIPMGPHPRQRLPLRTLAGVDMPAVLVELAYLSNPAQVAAVVTPEFQSAVADALTEALVRSRQDAGAVR